MLTCAMCGKPLKECCDLFYEAVTEDGEDVVVCADCVTEHGIETEEEEQTQEQEREQG